MYRSIFIASIATLAAAQSTLEAVNQIQDGQVQAPTATVVASAPVPTSAPYENPFTIYLTQTNEWGVITGMPDVQTSQPLPAVAITSQPSLITSQPVSPTHSYGNSTTLHTITTSAETTSETDGSSSTSAATSPSVAPLSESGADTNRIAGAGLALVVVSIGFFML